MFTESRVFYVDSTFFDVFSFPLVAGDAATALRRQDAVVVSETLARKLFGDEDPLGQVLTLDFTQQHVVTGVLAYPANSTLKPDLLVPYVNIEPRPFLNWSNTLMPIYVRLAEATDPAALEPGIGGTTASRTRPSSSCFPSVRITWKSARKAPS